MKPKKQSRITDGIKLFTVIAILFCVIISFNSCSGSRRAVEKKAEVQVPPPPPPSPPPVLPGPPPPPLEVFTVVEEMPEYPGGDKALMEFIAGNIQYPEVARQKQIQGRVIVRFVVNYDGTVGQVMILRGVDPSLDNEAVRVMKMLPVWKPGKQGGKPVNVWYNIPVTFALGGQPKDTVPSPPPPPPPLYREGGGN